MGTTLQTTILHSIGKETGEGRTVPPNLTNGVCVLHSGVCAVVCHGLHMPPYLQKDHIMDSRHEEGRQGWRRESEGASYEGMKEMKRKRVIVL